MPTLLPDDFLVPQPFADDVFRLEPLGRGHNVEDLQAWSSSIEHIKQTPGFAGRGWPDGADSLEQNLLSLTHHEQDFTLRRGFAYVVCDAKTSEYLGCVYFYPPRTGDFDVDVRSWVRTEKAHLDQRLRDAILGWLRDSWPWRAADYAPR